MHIFHPAQAVYGTSPENVFYVADSANQTVAEGVINAVYQPYLFPERPVNIFINIRSQGPGREMLLGALLARARQLHEQSSNMPARVYAQVSAQDTAMLRFYNDFGFDTNDALDLIQLGVPNARPAAPMGYSMEFVPMNNQAEASAFLQRLNNYRLLNLHPTQLQRYMALPHFFVQCLVRGNELVGEIAFTGQGRAAKLIGLYITPNYRRQGLAKCMIASGMRILAERGVTYVEAEKIRRNVAQEALARSCGATTIKPAVFYPGMNYD